LRRFSKQRDRQITNSRSRSRIRGSRSWRINVGNDKAQRETTRERQTAEHSGMDDD